MKNIKEIYSTILNKNELVLARILLYGDKSFKDELNLLILFCVKIIQIRSFSGPHFPVFGLSSEAYYVNLRIQSKYGKIRTRKVPYL